MSRLGIFFMVLFAGFVGLVLPQHCPKDYWGENCEKRCEIHCDQWYGCDKISGTCLRCDNGYWGNFCNQRCHANCDRYCDKINGYCYTCIDDSYLRNACNVSCSEKWPNCKTCFYITDSSCRACNPGYWNTTCSNKCNVGCYECDKTSGTCLRCLPRFYGASCSNRCPGEHCLHCRVSDGFCVQCDEGYWGDVCQNTCNLKGCNSSICEKYSGSCPSCKKNYWGVFCNNSCEIKNCKRYKNEQFHYPYCDQMNGSSCVECENSKWGSNCEFNCSENCTGLCETSSGTCDSCVSGTWGSTCNAKCLGDHCEYCNKHTGQCQKCRAGYWGTNCQNKCETPNCSQCNIGTGTCQSCNEGYWGASCENTCELEHCRYSFCEKNSGICSTCDGNYWGDTCNKSCKIPECASAVECSKTEGPKCYYCAEGKWGETCNAKCPGNCISGCTMSSGKCITENYVSQEIVDKSYDSPVAISVGVCFLVGLLILLAAHVGLNRLCKRVKQRNTPDRVTNTANAKEYVCSIADAVNGSRPPTDNITLNEGRALQQTMSASGSVDEDVDYETCIERVSPAYDNLAIGTA